MSAHETHMVVKQLPVFTTFLCDHNNINADLIKLTYNYPVEVKVEYDKNNKKYLKYSYKTDYTKPEETKYYHCKKI